MKRIIICLFGVLLVTACAATPKTSVEEAKEEAKQVAEQKPTAAPKEEVNKDCKINGHDCWAVVQKLGKTKEIRTENPDKDNIWVPDIITYENKELTKISQITILDIFHPHRIDNAFVFGSAFIAIHKRYNIRRRGLNSR